MSEPTPPTMAYWHVYTDADGISRQTQCELTQFKFEGVDPQTAPQWNDKQEKTEAGVTFTVLPGAGSASGTRIPARNGSPSSPAAGSWRPWTAPASRWGRAN